METILIATATPPCNRSALRKSTHGGSGSGDLRSFFSGGGGGSSSSAKRTAAVATVAGVSGEAPIELGSDGDTEEDEPSTKKARTRGPMGETLVID